MPNLRSIHLAATPGLPVSVLQSFNRARCQALIDDVDLYRERVQATATGILTLLDIDADPVASARTHSRDLALARSTPGKTAADLDVAGVDR